MVCQAASQTRFRALKHENGISGRTTIVVRVIACFQPLQNCQVCSLGWMVTAEELRACKPFPAWDSRDLNQMALQLDQNCSLPHFIPSALTENLALPGQQNSHLRQPNGVDGNISFPFGNPTPEDFQPGIGVLDKPVDTCAGKRFLIFDRSGNHTRLFVGPSFTRQDNISPSKVPAAARGLCKEVASGVVEEKWDENNLSDGEGEMVEDSEEINALLYSDGDDEYDYDYEYDDDDDGENYEVTSTRHTLLSLEDCSHKGQLLEQVMEEVASSDASPKRRKLLDGSCKKSSLVSVDDTESYCGGDEIDSSKVKLHEAVKILGSIIPGSSSSDPLSIIEKAIVYLETMKMEAKTLGFA